MRARERYGYQEEFIKIFSIKARIIRAMPRDSRENRQCSVVYSVAKPPLFWAVPAPEAQGPGADSCSEPFGSAPAPDNKGRLQATPAPDTKFVISAKLTTKKSDLEF